MNSKTKDLGAPVIRTGGRGGETAKNKTADRQTFEQKLQQWLFGAVGVRPFPSVVGVQWFVDAFGVHRQFLDGFIVQQFSGTVGVPCLIDILNIRETIAPLFVIYAVVSD